jgi:hypothetical protein
MRIVPGEEIELEYGAAWYKFRIIRVTSCSEGYDVDILMTDDFRSAFKGCRRSWQGGAPGDFKSFLPPA